MRSALILIMMAAGAHVFADGLDGKTLRHRYVTEVLAKSGTLTPDAVRALDKVAQRELATVSRLRAAADFIVFLTRGKDGVGLSEQVALTLLEKLPQLPTRQKLEEAKRAWKLVQDGGLTTPAQKKDTLQRCLEKALMASPPGDVSVEVASEIGQQLRTQLLMTRLNYGILDEKLTLQDGTEYAFRARS